MGADGASALTVACFHGHLQVVMLLCVRPEPSLQRRKVDPTIRDWVCAVWDSEDVPPLPVGFGFGFMPLRVAMKRVDVPVISFLCQFCVMEALKWLIKKSAKCSRRFRK